ncbi:MBL fold metallo-hydrolase [Tepidibacter thalassicus]|uniref:7,8-dihydropterin-6-yl-methyl-4-(Beta-D-ribofuranosyl)aminobenzene 5'-phosphate synthase n=1 Tax=Tepidibacter thalassicus DSM 15285 TaxID=1123350 RepID=A0A1M5NQB3_9FIRM|nr:MBL fold metallo-hydrolase [Tepidibacter thalassicus]SHG91625.1 7,8-dihydropterin-6-yl-methyl-4-(beta-D-ribofuranosyl)aminobenzene 5'-phosphate synthase [Tepidibacter thalassicus DSM 15285]
MNKIITLMDNYSKEKKFISEHGLSMYIEKDGVKILFDTGQSKNFTINSRLLNVDLSNLDFVVLSHGHYDHTGGFRYLVENFKSEYTLFVGDKFFNEKYSYNGENYRFSGNNFDLKFLVENNININIVKKDIVEICKDVFIVKNFEASSGFEKINKRFYLKENGEYNIDNFDDEIAIVIKTEKGLVVVVGCSHIGIVNILSTIRDRFKQRIHMVLGGSHLKEADSNRIDMTIDYLKNEKIDIVSLCHCTGDEAIEKLLDSGIKFLKNSVGTIINF